MLTKKDKQGLFLLSGVVAILLVFIIISAILGIKPKAGIDNCIGEPESNTVIVIDHSEQITDQTRDEIVARAMSHILDKVKIHERISIFTISGLSKKSLRPVIPPLCRPPDDGNRAIENVKLIRKRFHENFEEPLRKALLIPPGDHKESPIAQTLTDISLSQYLRGNSNTLLIFSDMLENTEKFSLYKCSSGNDVIARYRESRRGALERPDFKNTMVFINIIPRLTQSKEMLLCRDKFWTWFFGSNNGPQAGLTIEYLPGGASMSSSNTGVSIK